MEGLNNIFVDVANEVKEAVDVAKEAAQSTFQDMMDFTTTDENVSVEEMNWQMVLLVSLVVLSLGVIVCAAVKVFKSENTEKKKKEGKKN